MRLTADTNGPFDIKGNGDVPGLTIVYDQDTIPMLMGIVCDPLPKNHDGATQQS